MANIKTAKQKEQERHEAVVLGDIAKIEQAVAGTGISEETLIALHRVLDGKYQSCISNWGHSMYGYLEGHGFCYEHLSKSSLIDNLHTMKPKLEAFMQGWNTKGSTTSVQQAPDANVTVNNTVNITVSFEEARQKIEDMNSLNREQTDEILAKIDELEAISKAQTSKKNKWEKVKPIISFVMDKGADVAIAILTLIVQMKLGI